MCTNLEDNAKEIIKVNKRRWEIKESFRIIKSLREMNLLLETGIGYIPTYERTDLTDELHEKFGFRTDYEITTITNLKKILKNLKK